MTTLGLFLLGLLVLLWALIGLLRLDVPGADVFGHLLGLLCGLCLLIGTAGGITWPRRP